MGGKAFHQQFSAEAFPRIPTPVYEKIKERLLKRLQLIYTRVGVPHEAPGKNDHGDLDFLVVGPLGSISDVKNAIGATSSICFEGNRTSNFAVPVDHSEWEGVTDGCYYQVDIHVCADDDEWERIFFSHSYGDLGMILGLLARNNGLALGTKGLKLLDPPNPHFELSSSFPLILSFLGLSYDSWTQGFSDKEQIFKWVATSRLFDSTSFRVEGEGIHKVKRDRTMYAEFVSWVCAQQQQDMRNTIRHEFPTTSDLREEALSFFKKQDEFYGLIRGRVTKAQLKTIFNAEKVTIWIGQPRNWYTAKSVMRSMREMLGGDEGVLKCWGERGEEELRRIALVALKELDSIDDMQGQTSEVSVSDSDET